MEYKEYLSECGKYRLLVSPSVFFDYHKYSFALEKKYVYYVINKSIWEELVEQDNLQAAEELFSEKIEWEKIDFKSGYDSPDILENGMLNDIDSKIEFVV